MKVDELLLEMNAHKFGAIIDSTLYKFYLSDDRSLSSLYWLANHCDFLCIFRECGSIDYIKTKAGMSSEEKQELAHAIISYGSDLGFREIKQDWVIG